jgi:hypothetical protein
VGRVLRENVTGDEEDSKAEQESEATKDMDSQRSNFSSVG